MHVAEVLLLLLVGQIAQTVPSALLHSQGLAIGPVALSVLEEANSQVGEGQKNGGTEAAHHGDDSSGVLGCLFFSECLRADEVACSVADIDDGERDGLLGASGSVGLGERDKDNVRSCCRLVRCCREGC